MRVNLLPEEQQTVTTPNTQEDGRDKQDQTVVKHEDPVRWREHKPLEADWGRSVQRELREAEGKVQKVDRELQGVVEQANRVIKQREQLQVVDCAVEAEVWGVIKGI